MSFEESVLSLLIEMRDSLSEIRNSIDGVESSVSNIELEGPISTNVTLETLSETVSEIKGMVDALG